MDVCCYNRPMDDQTQMRIYIESEAVREILSKCEEGVWELLGSEVLILEISKNTRDENRQRVLSLLKNCVSEMYLLSEDVILRANELTRYNIKSFDSLHLAAAEYANADVLLTVDDKFI